MSTPSHTIKLGALALAVSAAVFASGAAFSQTTAPAGKPAQSDAGARSPHASATRVSEDGYRAMRDVRLARLEIFNGNTRGAGERVAAAKRALDAAETEGRTHFAALRPKSSTPIESGLWVPIEGRINIEDDYTATPKKQEYITAANQHLRKGEHAKAMEQLRLAEVDVGVSRVLMPLGPTRAKVQAAERLMGEGKYYEANLELKHAEEGLVIDSEVLITRPQTAAPAR
jgi:YfdX protein